VEEFLAARSRQHSFFCDRLRLDLGRVHPGGVLAGHGTAIFVSGFNFEERVLAKLGQKLPQFRLHPRLKQLARDFVLNFLEFGEARLLMVVHLQDEEPVPSVDRISDEPSRLGPHGGLELRPQLTFFVRPDLAALLRAARIGVRLRQFVEFLTLLGARRYVLGLLLRGALPNYVLAFGRHQNLPQEHTLVPLKFVLVLLVVFSSGLRV